MAECSGEEVTLLIAGVDGITKKQEAVYYLRSGSHYLLYEESIEGCDSPFRSRIKFRPGYLELKRKGTVNMELIFEKGKKHRVFYNTSVGSIMLTLEAEEIQILQKPEEISVEVCYYMGQEDWQPEKKNLKITIKRGNK